MELFGTTRGMEGGGGGGKKGPPPQHLSHISYRDETWHSNSSRESRDKPFHFC